MEVEYPFADLLQVSTMTLATTSQDGIPHAAPVYFAASPGLELYFFSDPDSQHGRDLESNPQAAAALYPQCDGWKDIRGLQMRGRARILARGLDWDAAWEAYREKFPFVAGLKAIVARNSLYVFRPYWIRMVDNRRGFGFKQEWDLK